MTRTFVRLKALDSAEDALDFIDRLGAIDHRLFGICSARVVGSVELPKASPPPGQHATTDLQIARDHSSPEESVVRHDGGSQKTGDALLAGRNRVAGKSFTEREG